MEYVLLALIAIPLLSTPVFMLIPNERADFVRYFALAGGIAMFSLSALVFFAYEYDGGNGLEFTLQWAWLENIAFFGENGISLYLGVDGIAAPLVFLNGIVVLAAVSVAWNITHRAKDYFVLLFLLVSGVYGVFLLQDLFFFFFFYEVAVLPMYLLIAVWGSSSDFGTFKRTKEYGAMKLTLMLVAGSVLIFVAIFATFYEAGIGTFDMVALSEVTYSEDFQKTFFPFYMIGFGVLAGMWPFHTWSPDGHVAAPTSVSMLHAGVLMKLGAFGILRVGMTQFPEGADYWAPVLMTLGVSGALYGAVSAIAQKDLKYMVGYSSVSHMGYVLMGLASMTQIGVTGAVLQMFAHGVMTALMFTNVGAVYDQAHIRDMTKFGGLAKQMPRHTAFLTIAGLSSLGLPGLAGFVAEVQIFIGVFQADYYWAGVIAVIAAAITATYILRMLARAYFGPFNETWIELKEMRFREQFAGALLIAAILFMGLWPMPFIDRVTGTVANLPGITLVSELNFEWELLLPEYILVIGAALIILVDLFFISDRNIRGGKVALGYLGAIVAAISAASALLWVDDSTDFAGLIDINDYTTFFRVFFALIAMFACLASARYVDERLLHPGEYYAFILLCVVGANGMAAASELLTAYLSLELLSFSLYVLTSYAKFDSRSTEAGLKYMLLGAFSSALFLYGISLIYGTTGSTHYAEIGEVVSGDIGAIQESLYLGLALIIAGLGFKVAAVPFHMWTPDAYEGAPLPVTAYISAISKSAGFALFLKLFAQAFNPLIDDWKYLIAGLAVATMVLGNLVAIQQSNIKRLLAYSSIGQVGYLLVGVAALSPDSAGALVLHMAGYVVTNLAAFVCVIIFYNKTGQEEIKDFSGLADRAPFLALALTIALFSLAGMPLFAGFTTKFILFQAAAQEDLLWLAGIAALMSFISLYYYLVIIREMYLGTSDGTRFSTPWFEYGVLAILVFGVFAFGLYPQPMYEVINDSTTSIFASASDAAVSR